MTNELTLKDAVSDLESFGHRSLTENAVEVDKALAKTEYLHGIFNHSHSQFAWRHLTLAWLSPARNLRQIASELARKRDALWEAKWRCIERNETIRELTSELAANSNRRAEMALQRAKEEQQKSITLIEGAMKDILVLTRYYDDLIAKHDIKTEEDFEKHEAFSHLCRALSQSLRDVRQFDAIKTGDQEYLEQIGINPTTVLLELRSRIEHETTTQEWGTSDLYEYIYGLAKKLEPYVAQRVALMGYTEEPIKEGLMLNGKHDG